METIKLKLQNGKYAYGNCWKVKEGVESKGNVVICHGMAEHSQRYDRFATFLNEHGYDVYAVDHPGHGLNVTVPETPDLGLGVWPASGFKLAIEYLHDLIVQVRLTMKPIVLFGHSMGSIVAQRYFQRYSQSIDGLILCGTTFGKAEYTFGRILSKIMSKFMSQEKQERPSPFFNNIQVNQFNRGVPAFEDGYVSKSRWISVNEDNVKAFDLDPMCGFVPSFNFYYNLFGGMKPTFQRKRIKAIKNKIPTLLVVGELDPVGSKTKRVKKLQKIYNEEGIQTDLIVYPNMRHEILNEDDYMKVQEDCLQYIDKATKRAIEIETDAIHHVNQDIFK